MPNPLAANLVRLRKKRKLSQREVAAQLNISPSLLSHYERGIREGNIDFLIRASAFYSVSCDVLLGCSTEEIQMQALLQTDSTLSTDNTLNLLTITRATGALTRADESLAAPPLIKALAVLLLRADVQHDIPTHWINAALEELLNDVQIRKSTAACLQTVQKNARQIVHDTIENAVKS